MGNRIIRLIESQFIGMNGAVLMQVKFIHSFSFIHFHSFIFIHSFI